MTIIALPAPISAETIVGFASDKVVVAPAADKKGSTAAEATRVERAATKIVSATTTLPSVDIGHD